MNILIVDDDSIIRKWLALMLNQIEKYSIKIFEASDGIEATELCAINPIDLMITDIKMPLLNGIGVLERLKVEKPSIRTVVLSSYDDFNFVRKALKSGAIDYIRKAEMTIEDITLILDKVYNDIELEKKLIDLDENALYEILDRKKNFNNYIEHNGPGFFDFISSDLPDTVSTDLCVAIFKANDISGKFLPIASIVNICDSIIYNAGLIGICVPWKEDMFVVNYKCHNVVREYQEEEFLKIFETINSYLKKHHSITIPYCINMLCCRGSSYINTFNSVLEEFENRTYYGIAKLTSASSKSFLSTFNINDIINAISSNLINQNYSEAFTELKNFIKLFHEHHVSPTVIRENCSLLFYLFYAHSAIFDSQGSNENSLLNFVRQLDEVRTESEISHWVENFEIKYFEYITIIYNKFSPVIKNAIQYINNNYFNKITLDQVANEVFRNRTYFSQLFKKEVGINFHNYLEDVRIKNAIILINRGDKTLAEIPEHVGFSNQTYFSKIFKHYTGISPAKFKKKVYKNT